MTLDTTTNFELPLPHPDNSPRTVDVPRLRAALTAIDGLLKELQDRADDLDEDKADKTQVATDIANAVSAAISDLLDGAPEAYDTLKEIADKLGDNDSAVGAILSQIAALQSGKADLASGKVPFTQLPVASSEDAAAGTGDGLVNAGQVGGHVDAKIAAAIGELRHVEYTAKYPITAGDPVVLLPDGKVMGSEVVEASVGAPVEISASNGSYIAVCYHPVEDAFVVVWLDDSDNSGKVTVCDVDGSNVTVVATETFSSGELDGNASNNISICYDSSRNQFIIAYAVSGAARLRTCQIAGSSIAFGTEVTTGQSARGISICYDKSVDRALLAVFATSYDILASVVTISGSSVSVSAFSNVGTGVNAGRAVVVVHCDGHPTAGMNAIVYSASNADNRYLRHHGLKIDPETFALNVVSGANGTNANLAKTLLGPAATWSRSAQRNYVFGAGAEPSYYGKLTTWTVGVSGTSAPDSFSTVDSTGAINDVYQNFAAIAALNDGEQIAVVWPDRGSSYYGKLRFTNLSTTLILSTEIQFASENVGWTGIAFSDDGKKGMIAYTPGSSMNTGKPKAVAITPPKADRRTSFIGFAATSAEADEPVLVIPPFGIDRSQSGLTRGASYSLGADGTLTASTSAPRVGFALSETELLVLGSNIYQV